MTIIRIFVTSDQAIASQSSLTFWQRNSQIWIWPCISLTDPLSFRVNLGQEGCFSQDDARDSRGVLVDRLFPFSQHRMGPLFLKIDLVAETLLVGREGLVMALIDFMSTKAVWILVGDVIHVAEFSHDTTAALVRLHWHYLVRSKHGCTWTCVSARKGALCKTSFMLSAPKVRLWECNAAEFTGLGAHTDWKRTDFKKGSCDELFHGMFFIIFF